MVSPSFKTTFRLLMLSVNVLMVDAGLFDTSVTVEAGEDLLCMARLSISL